MAKKRFYSEMADNHGKTAEFQGGEMIESNFNAFANMPQEVKMKEYPKGDYSDYPEYPDNIRSKDREMDRDARFTRKEAFKNDDSY